MKFLFYERRSDGYLVKMGLGSLMTMTVLFIMILPEKEMGLEKLVEHQCGIPGTGTKHFYLQRKNTYGLSAYQCLSAGR